MSEPSLRNRPIASVVVRPKKNHDSHELQRALSDLGRQDPAVRISAGPLEGETTISGMGELELELICERITQEYGVKMDVGEPTAIYLETIRRQADAEGKFIRQTGGRGQYGHAKIRLEPNPGKGYEFVNEILGASVPKEYIKPVENGIKEALEGGVLAGYEMIDVKAVLYDGSYHDVDSSEMAFKIAGSMALKEAAKKASPVLLEPVMAVAAVVPEDFMSAVIGDLNSRRGRIEGMEHRAGSQVIHAVVPLAEMFGYAKHIRLSTQGRTELSLYFLRYEDAPRGGGSRGDEAGVTAKKPKSPKAGTDSAAAALDTE